MIKPTIGRVVWVFRPYGSSDISQAEVGLITYVWNDRCVNVVGFDYSGDQFKLLSLTLIQDNEPKPEGNFAAWMPYQKGQAAKTESLQATLEPFGVSLR